MSTQVILKSMLVLHFIALALAIGITLANAVAFRQFWKLYDRNKAHGLSAFRAITKLQVFGILGLMLLILTGIAMLWLFQWTLVALLWFRIKLLFVLLLFVNGFTLGRTTTMKLQVLISEERDFDKLQPETIRLRKNLRIFQLTQLCLFTIIIILAVFRFS